MVSVCPDDDFIAEASTGTMRHVPILMSNHAATTKSIATALLVMSSVRRTRGTFEPDVLENHPVATPVDRTTLLNGLPVSGE
jgi:hypothetical protein